MGRKWRHPNTSCCPGTQWNQARLHGLTHPTSLDEKHAPTPILVLNPVHRKLGLSSRRKLGNILDFCIWKEKLLPQFWGTLEGYSPLWNWQRLLFTICCPAISYPPSPFFPSAVYLVLEALILWLVCFCSPVADLAPDVYAKSPPIFPHSPRCPHQPI